ncbi:MAG: class I adenylate-forming enzyme family protein [Candidatus Hodarchaeota archaeon]
MRDPEKDKECEKRYEEMLPRMFDYPDKWAKEKGDAIAIIEYDTGEEITWKDFATKSKAFAAKLLAMGIKKGDVVATTLPLLKEHVYLMYACYRMGALFAPLDLRLKANEIKRCFEKIKPKAYFFLGKTPVIDFRPIIAEVMEEYKDSCEYWIQFQKEEDMIIDGAIGVTEFAKDIKGIYIKALLTGKVKKAQKKVGKRDPCLIIFTTGSTGFPKPALICHENILIQDIGLHVAFSGGAENVYCVNLPTSHVGCTTEQLAVVIYGGGVAVILHVFDAEKTLDAIQKYKITKFGQIPALFEMQWRLPNYSDYDLSSLNVALYGGQAVTKKFLEKLVKMAPNCASGYGLTETAGFCTYTPIDGTLDEIAASAGFDMPICPLTIREPMKEDGSAGDEKPKGEIGEICCSGPQVFLGYLGDEENTKKTISTDGILYTGDLGTYDETGLHISGRSKLMIKPKGYNVFPTEVEEHITAKLKSKVGLVACVGIPHEVFTEGIMAFVEKLEGSDVTVEELNAAVKDIAAYKRPTHFELIEYGSFPLNRVAKTDYVELKKRGLEIAEKLRKSGGWDGTFRVTR